MRRRVLQALAALVLFPAVAVAVPRPPQLRLHPREISGRPSYVRRSETAIVGLRVRARSDAPSSARLGIQRFASAVVFDARGYAVTVSYVLMDAVEVEALRRDGRVVPAHVVGVDLDAGLGVVKLDGEAWMPVALGDSRDVERGALTGTVGVDEENDLVWVTGRVRAVRRFAASWEYMLERAFIVRPASESWGGSALVNERGELIGIGSLRLGEQPYANMFIPLERFLSVKDELIATGRVVSRAPRPWLGLYTSEEQDGITVEGFSPVGPAAAAGFRRGDRIVRVNDVAVGSQEEFYETLWRHRAGDVIRVAVRRDDRLLVIAVQSVDRHRGFVPHRP